MKPNSALRTSRSGSRQASILVSVLVCLAVTTALVTSMVRTALNARRAMCVQHQVRQTELLLAAGVQRAARQLQASDDYAGETWNLSSQAIPGIESSRVRIELTPAEGDSSPEVHVTAQLMAAKSSVVQRSYSFPVDPQRSPEKE